MTDYEYYNVGKILEETKNEFLAISMIKTLVNEAQKRHDEDMIEFLSDIISLKFNFTLSFKNELLKRG